MAAVYGYREGAVGPGYRGARDGGGRCTDQHDHTEARSFTVTAVSRDGQHTTATVTYTVMLSDNRFSARPLRIYRNGTVEFDVTVPYAGQLDVLETSWKPSPPRALQSVLLRPGSRRYAFARRHLNLARTRHPPRRPRPPAVHHHRPVQIKLWVTYKPAGGNSKRSVHQPPGYQ